MQYHVRIINNKEVNAMFEMQRVGKKIADLRKSANMTQGELADRLGISFQAVSNWERGNTCPDISKLGELSEIFGCTIDELLGNKRAAEVAEAIAGGETPEMTAAELADVAPILKPEQVDRSFRGLMQHAKVVIRQAKSTIPDILNDAFRSSAQSEQQEAQERQGAPVSPDAPNTPNAPAESAAADVPPTAPKRDDAANDAAGLSYEELVALAPFISSSLLDSMALKLAGSIGLNGIAELAPFMDEETIDELALKASKDGSAEDFAALLPFMSEDAIGDVAREIAKRGGFEPSQLTALAPFMCEDDLGDIARKLSKDGFSLHQLAALAPFMDEDDISEIVNDIVKKQGSGVDIEQIVTLAPFMDEDVLTEIAAELAKTKGLKAILPLLPFIDADDLAEQLRG